MENEQVVREMINKDTRSAMEKHVSRFAKDGFFSPSTVAAGLEKIHSSHSTAKGGVIAAFNSAHSGNWMCPFGSTEFKADKDGYAKYLHLGTTRNWNVNGEVDPVRWKKFETFVTKNQEDNVQKVVTKSTLMRYLQVCYENDPQEQNTGRNTNSWFSSATVQSTAATKAWDEVFDRLTCGWEINETTNDYEPYINLDLVYWFFKDSEAAFLEAEKQNLPIAMPEPLSTSSTQPV